MLQMPATGRWLHWMDLCGLRHHHKAGLHMDPRGSHGVFMDVSVGGINIHISSHRDGF